MMVSQRRAYSSIALERIEPVADEDGDGHGGLRDLSAIAAHQSQRMLRLRSNYAAVANQPSRPGSRSRLAPAAKGTGARTAARSRNDRLRRGVRAAPRDSWDSAASRRARI